MSDSLYQRIEWFIEGQAFSRSSDLAPPPTPPPTSQLSVSSTGDTPVDWERESSCWREGGGGGIGEEPNHTTARKPGPLQIIQDSLSYTDYRYVLLRMSRKSSRSPLGVTASFRVSKGLTTEQQRLKRSPFFHLNFLMLDEGDPHIYPGQRFRLTYFQSLYRFAPSPPPHKGT